MAITLDDATRTVVAAAITGLVDAGAGVGKLQVATSTNFTTNKIVDMNLSDPAFTAGAAGVQNMDVTPAVTAAASGSGTATNYRFVDSTDAVVWTGAVATTADGSDIVLATSARNAGLNAINALCQVGSTDATADLEIATAAGFGAGTLITLPLNNPAFDAAASGTMALDVTPAITGNTLAAGTATQFRVKNRNNAVVYSGPIADLSFNNPTFGVGTTVNIVSHVVSLPDGTTPSGSAGPLVFAGGVAITAGEQIEVTSCSYTQPA